MKKLSILLLAALPFFSCNDDDVRGQFIFQIRNLTFDVDPTIQPPGTFYIPINGVLTNIENQLAVNGMEASQVAGIVPRNATLNVAFQDARIDFIEDMSIRLCTQGDNEPNWGQEAFWRTDIPFDTGFSLGLNGSNVSDLDRILLDEFINVQVKLERLYSQPLTTFTITLDMEFEVR